MPVRKVQGGYQWGETGKVYPTRTQAERQDRAIIASGWREKINSINQSKRKEVRVMKILSNEKGDGTRTYWLSRWTFVLAFFTSVVLMVGGFFTPPKGVIDGSVLTASGELLLFPTLLYAFRALELGYKVKFQKGETSIEFNQKE